MASRKFPVARGDWFIIPLRRGFHSLGFAARIYPKTFSFLGYYFAPALTVDDAAARITQLGPASAILVAASSAAILRENTWKIIGNTLADSTIWPIPVFSELDILGRSRTITFEDSDTWTPVEIATDSEFPDIPTHALHGSGLFGDAAIEDKLYCMFRDKWLSGNDTASAS